MGIDGGGGGVGRGRVVAVAVVGNFATLALTQAACTMTIDKRLSLLQQQTHNILKQQVNTNAQLQGCRGRGADGRAEGATHLIGAHVDVPTVSSILQHHPLAFSNGTTATSWIQSVCGRLRTAVCRRSRIINAGNYIVRRRRGRVRRPRTSAGRRPTAPS